ncbi:MAG: PIN domain-containing protein [Thermoplasmatota archaeon]
MTRLADLNLVLTTLKDEDKLKRRAMDFLAKNDPPTVTSAVGLELLLWCRKHRPSYIDWTDRMIGTFPVENSAVLLTAAQALKEGETTSPFDAMHMAEALHRGQPLVTADEPYGIRDSPSSGSNLDEGARWPRVVARIDLDLAKNSGESIRIF